LREGGEELNVLKPNVRITIATLLRAGTGQREIARVTGVDRKTIRRQQTREANSSGVATGSAGVEHAEGVEIPPPRPPAPIPKTATSACSPLFFGHFGGANYDRCQ